MSELLLISVFCLSFTGTTLIFFYCLHKLFKVVRELREARKHGV